MSRVSYCARCVLRSGRAHVLSSVSAADYGRWSRGRNSGRGRCPASPSWSPRSTLDEVRSHIQTQTGASTYTIDSEAIAAAPGGENSLLNQVVLQAPDVAQDSFGQYHVRGEHNGLQYRINGVILPEGISVFGQSLDPRLISSISLVTGSVACRVRPAHRGHHRHHHQERNSRRRGAPYRVYGGSHGEVEPSVAYGGGSGAFSYFVTADFLRNDLGIESPDGSSNPIHDHTTQYHGFGYFEDILNDENQHRPDARQRRGPVSDPGSRTERSPPLGSVCRRNRRRTRAQALE